MPRNNLVGMKFNKLTVLKLSYKNGKYHNWICQCDCGSIKEYREDHIINGDTKSCGCIRKESTKSRIINKLGVYGLINDLYTMYRRRIVKKNMEFSLSREEFYNLVNSDCFYCGAKPSNILTNGKADKEPLIYNGIDRIDSSIGYISNNVVTCCKKCNYAKRDMTIDEFKLWLINTYNKTIIGKT